MTFNTRRFTEKDENDDGIITFEEYLQFRRPKIKEVWVDKKL